MPDEEVKALYEGTHIPMTNMNTFYGVVSTLHDLLFLSFFPLFFSFFVCFMFWGWGKSCFCKFNFLIPFYILKTLWYCF